MEILITLFCPLAGYVLTKWLRHHRPRLAFLPLVAAGLLFLMGWREAVTPDYLMDLSDLYYGLLAVLIVVGWIAGAGGVLRRYRPLVAILLAQYLVFYLYPAIRLRTDPIGTVMFMLLLTFLLSFFAGIWFLNKLKLLWPPVTALLFLPSIPIYYNESALVHALWYLVVSALGVAAGRALFHRGQKQQ